MTGFRSSNLRGTYMEKSETIASVPATSINQDIEAAKPQFAADYQAAKTAALRSGFNEKEASELADLWVDVKARYHVLDPVDP